VIAAKMFEIADELEDRAAEIERRRDRRVKH
jgi:hypothetical protein